MIGGLIGLIGGPLGVLFHGSVGALIGATIDTEDQLNEYSKIEHISKTLEDGETALISLAQENDKSFLDMEFGIFDAEITRYDAVEVAQEIEELEEQRRLEEKEAKKAKREEQKAERKAKLEEKIYKNIFQNLKNNKLLYTL